MSCVGLAGLGVLGVLGAAAEPITAWRTIAPGVRMPRLSLGHPDVGNKTTPAGTAAALELWLGPSVNGSGVDTAWDYGNQKQVGQAIRASGRERASVFVTTKVPGTWGRARALNNVRSSLGALQLAHVDLLLIHFPCESMLPWPCKHADAAAIQDTWRGLQDAVALGLARAIGVSNFGVDDMRPILALNATGPDCTRRWP